MPDRIKTLFMGTPDFAVTVLEALADDPAIEIVGVVTQPDRPVGRRQVITPPPVKVFAQNNDIPIYQPEKIKEFDTRHSTLDTIVVAAYAQILPKNILDLPRFGCINIHASLLPRYRGASCVAAAIRDGAAKTGVTIMKMDEGLDTGDILRQAELTIEPDDTAGTLTAKLAGLGAGMVVPAIKDFVTGKITPLAQDNSLASYAPALKKSDGQIDWTKNAAAVERFIRAMQPWPGAWCEWRMASGEWRVKIIKTLGKPIKSHNTAPGKFFVHDNNLAAQCADAALIIEQIQPEGKKVLNAKNFIQGYLKA